MNVSEVVIQPRSLEDDKLGIQSLQAVAARKENHDLEEPGLFFRSCCLQGQVDTPQTSPRPGTPGQVETETASGGPPVLINIPSPAQDRPQSLTFCTNLTFGTFRFPDQLFHFSHFSHLNKICSTVLNVERLHLPVCH